MFGLKPGVYLHRLLPREVVGQSHRRLRARLLRLLRIALVQHVYLPPEVAVRETLQQTNTSISGIQINVAS